MLSKQSFSAHATDPKEEPIHLEEISEVDDATFRNEKQRNAVAFPESYRDELMLAAEERLRAKAES